VKSSVVPDVVFGLFLLGTFIAIVFGAYLMSKLKHFPNEFLKAGSPLPYSAGNWTFFGYVIAGRFDTIPDSRLVTAFQIYRLFETVRLGLFVLAILLLVA